MTRLPMEMNNLRSFKKLKIILVSQLYIKFKQLIFPRVQNPIG